MKTVIKKFIKLFIDYRIVEDTKKYTIKHTNIGISHSLKKVYEKKWANCKIQDNKIVFDNYMGKGYGCNPKYVTEELLKRNCELDIVWTVKDAKEQESAFPKGVRLVEYGSPEAYMEYATAKVWIGNYHLVAYLNKGLMKKPEQRYIQMWHGSFGIKKIENACSLLTQDKNWTYLAKKNSEYTDYWISNSGFETEVYKSSFWEVDKVLEYGHPRNDLFFHQEDMQKSSKKVCEYFNIAGKKIALYVPTYRDESMESSIYPDYDKVLENLKTRFSGEWVLLIRMHPRMIEYASKLIPNQDNIMDATKYPDIQELLAAADVVFTDYSSSIFDFMLTKKPGFLFVPDADAYDNSRGLYYPLSETPFPIAKSDEELQKNILCFDETEYVRKTEQFLLEKKSKEDGQAAGYVADLIEKIV